MSDEFMRSDLENAVNDVAVACLEAADMYETAAGRHEGTGLGRELANHGRARRQAADRLGRLLAENYDGPILPEPEKELIDKALSWMKSALSGDEMTSLLEDCRTAEERILETAAIALGFDLPAEIRGPVEELERDATVKISELDRHKAG